MEDSVATYVATRHDPYAVCDCDRGTGDHVAVFTTNCCLKSEPIRFVNRHPDMERFILIGNPKKNKTNCHVWLEKAMMT